MSKVGRFMAMAYADRILLLQSVGWLAMARAILLVVPFRRLSSWLSLDARPTQSLPNPELLFRIRWAVAVAARHVPWRSDCFPQAIAARMLLRRRDIESTIHIGVAREGGEKTLSGHAWLTSGDVVITGGGNLDRFSVLQRWPAAADPGL